MSIRVDDTAIECGAQFVHGGAQASYLQLLEELSLLEQGRFVRVPAGFTIWDAGRDRRVLHLPAHVRSFARFGLADWARAGKFGIFIGYCWALERWEKDWTLSVDQWLDGMRLLDDSYKHNVVKSFLYQFVSLPRERIGEASAKYAITYFVRAMFGGRGPKVERRDTRLASFETYQSRVGLAEVLRHVLRLSGVQARTDVRVLRVRHAHGGVEVETNDGTIAADQVVFATDPHTAAASLRAGQSTAHDLTDTLASLEFAALPISIYKGSPHELPPRRQDRQPFTTTIDGDDITFTVWFAPLNVFKSWGTRRRTAGPGVDTLLEIEHYVPLPTTTFMKRREQLQTRWQGDRGVWFAGGWTQWFDSQEAALVSANLVSAGIAPRAQRAVEMRL